MTEKDTNENQKKERGVSRKDFQELQARMDNLTAYVETMEHNMTQTIQAVRTQVQQILSYLPTGNERKEEQRQKFR